MSQTFLNKSASTNASQSWALKLEQCCNSKKLGITKFGVKDYTFSSSSAIVQVGMWEHVVWAYESNVVTAYINGLSVGTKSVPVPVLNWNIVYWFSNKIIIKRLIDFYNHNSNLKLIKTYNYNKNK